MTTTRKRMGLRLLAAPSQRRSASVDLILTIMAKGLFFGMLASSITSGQAVAASDAAQLPSLPVSAHEGFSATPTIFLQPVVAHRPKRANFNLEGASLEARQVADWVVDSGDNRSMPFVIVDKTDAKVFVFYADGRLRGAARALLGLARGDDAVPGIGKRALSTIRPEERTTPAGRFVAALGRDLHGKDILWVDYDGAIAMHRVITTNRKEHRLQRLATATTADKRISYGCINVPVIFYEKVVHPAFTGTNGVVYVLPEIKQASDVFGSYDVDEHTRTMSATQPVPVPVDSASLHQ